VSGIYDLNVRHKMAVRISWDEKKVEVNRKEELEVVSFPSCNQLCHTIEYSSTVQYSTVLYRTTLLYQFSDC
jgi:hypothetical protein